MVLFLISTAFNIWEKNFSEYVYVEHKYSQAVAAKLHGQKV